MINVCDDGDALYVALYSVHNHVFYHDRDDDCPNDHHYDHGHESGHAHDCSPNLLLPMV